MPSSFTSTSVIPSIPFRNLTCVGLGVFSESRQESLDENAEFRHLLVDDSVDEESPNAESPSGEEHDEAEFGAVI